ncbi:serine phosphatase RsbU (regulator of sigma subunit)/PAS domain-containing protein/anti-sigma regulatory factor (Ser/Thr protein kinase) [Kitasatospora sp. MAA19]|uniref:SpoIIE family protein phosphatase/ATP-binding protein n=1 Tax=Kitasatospora sp. MAA19 TaxID=3035090 RepID=UPI00247642D6|nr:SpoIIE family protein phosphatase/ATP-binding protein [Kitasatospora sp. MAA19]MDH6708774.1 serine phosphatase RsbU (regulator of sigma subunit)/PAS domain-containing protein/anti-sigma regulatory factor (Ser/Thr protein kinase) [Kitasatospora sp. MAA19]
MVERADRSRTVSKTSLAAKGLFAKSPRSVAGQVFVLQVAVVLLLVLGAILALVLESRYDSETEARNRSVAVAEAFAHAPGLPAVLKSPDPTAVLQPLTEAARQKAGVDFIVVMNTQGIRYTHPLPEQIGKKFVGTIGPSLAGQVYTESVHGPLGQEVQATVPVTAPDGAVVGLVSAGLKVKNVTTAGNRQLPVILITGAAALTLATAGTALVSRRLKRQTHGLGPTEMTRVYEHHNAVLHAVREGVVIVSADGRLLLANDEAKELLGLPADAEGRRLDELRDLDPDTAELLRSGRVATDEVHQAGGRLLAVNQRSTDRGGAMGTVATIRDSTELLALSGKAEVAGKRLALLYEAGVGIGTTFDVVRTAEELAQVAVPGFADFVTVDLADPVLLGDEPTGSKSDLRRAAVHGIREDHPFYPPGMLVTFLPSTPQARGFDTGRSQVVPDLSVDHGWLAQDPERTRQIVEYGVHSLITTPLRARGIILGVANFWRSRKREPFDEEERSLAEELVARASVSIDNARRYTREHAMAVTLQRSLLPRALPEQSALTVAHRYLPAQSGVSGDWFDVIPLPGSRVALVVGDVVGHGLHAAATMGRLRTAVHNFSTLDLPPDELLGHLDELVNRIDQEESDSGDGTAVTGATCLYAIYDPISQLCTIARAGHPAPALVWPDGSVVFPELPIGPPLGAGGMPFETAQVHLPEGTQIVLYTDGLIEERTRDFDVGMELLRGVLSEQERQPEEHCQAVLDALLPARPQDDVALLIAKTRVLGPNQVADREVPFDPASVADARAWSTAKLDEWGLADLAFGTELVLSELVTNAIRYGLPPVRVRLLRDRSLICEVADGSNTSPHLKYAATTDEGGRGLFLVSQLTDHWGTRYSPQGKIIWAEQPLPGSAGGLGWEEKAPPAALPEPPSPAADHVDVAGQPPATPPPAGPDDSPSRSP